MTRADDVSQLEFLAGVVIHTREPVPVEIKRVRDLSMYDLSVSWSKHLSGTDFHNVPETGLYLWAQSST